MNKQINKHLFWIFVVFLKSSLCFGYITEKVPLGCGYAGYVFDMIPKWTEGKSVLHASFEGRQGESGRHYFEFSDGSWIITFEFFSKDDVKYDLSCVVDKGTEEVFWKVPVFRLEKLPDLRMGPSLRDEDEALLTLQKIMYL